MPTDERPREKLIKYGPKTLSTSELLSILLRSGTKEKSAIDLSLEILANFGDLLKDASVKELMELNGVGIAKGTTIVAALELSSRFNIVKNNDRLNSPKKVYELFAERVRNLKVENFFSVLLNTKNEVIGIKTISVGTVNKVIVHPRDVFNEAIKNMASGVIVVHNHPSGDSTPSKEDIDITRRLIYVGEVVGIKLIDHIVVGYNNYTSLKEEGYFNTNMEL